MKDHRSHQERETRFSRAETITNEKRPNVLLIMTDQQCAGAMSCAGNKHLKTPAMDSIAATGVRFDRAYVAQPLCLPCRSSMQTGRFPHEIGTPANSSLMEGEFPMLGNLLTSAGYECAYLGKWHIGVDVKEEHRHGYSLLRDAKDRKLPQMAADFLKEERGKPFFLTVSFRNPHDVCQLSRRHELPQGPIPPVPPPDQCPPLPDNFAIPEHEPSAIRMTQRELSDKTYPTAGWDEDMWRQYLWGYYRLVEKVDQQIGQVLKALRESAYNDDTLIIFLSDHGEGVAGHHWNQKRVLYEETVHIPLLISQRHVTQAGVLDSEHFVSTGADLLPTILDFAGIPIPGDLRGRSLRPLVMGEEHIEWRDSIVTETLLCDGRDHDGVTGRMLRTERYKYIVYNAGKNREQMFDMESDPGEMRNLAVCDEYGEVLQEHRLRLALWCRQTGDDFPVVSV